MLKSHGCRTSTRRYLLTRTLPPRVCQWVSIVVHYLPLQRHQISPNSRQSQGKNLLGKILPHRPMVTSDQPLRLRPSSHLLFLHSISRPINCISPSSNSTVLFGLGVIGECCTVILERIWPIVTPRFGMQRRASHDLPKSPLTSILRDL